ncbi:helix-turn-helix transcriptional regulator [Paenibacillus chitinolyticus]
MRLDRMLGITMELLTRKRVTATELAARFEVSIRTIYRDVDLINQAGIPVASFTGTDGGFELMNGFFLTKQHFSVDDFSVIYNLLKGMEGAMGGPSVSLMQKLSGLQPALLKGGHHDKIVFDMSTSEGEKEIVHPLLHAINRTRVLAFSYTSATGTLSQRKVEPIKLYWERGAWYLEGYCLSHQAKRFFRVSRITELEVLDHHFQPRVLSSLPAEEEAQGVQAHLRFDLTAQPRVYEQFQGECTHHGDYIDVHTVFYSQEYAISIILSYSSKVTIISPDELKQDLMEKINEIQKLYTQRK